MIRVEHTEDNLLPAYAFHRDGTAPRSGVVGIIYGHEAADLVKELFRKMSRVEREEVLAEVADERCFTTGHDEAA